MMTKVSNEDKSSSWKFRSRTTPQSLPFLSCDYTKHQLPPCLKAFLLMHGTSNPIVRNKPTSQPQVIKKLTNGLLQHGPPVPKPLQWRALQLSSSLLNLSLQQVLENSGTMVASETLLTVSSGPGNRTPQDHHPTIHSTWGRPAATRQANKQFLHLLLLLSPLLAFWGRKPTRDTDASHLAIQLAKLLPSLASPPPLHHQMLNSKSLALTHKLCCLHTLTHNNRQKGSLVLLIWGRSICNNLNVSGCSMA